MEQIVDAYGCDPARLASQPGLAALIARIVEDLGLIPVADPVWKVFPGPGGITGLVLLSESHLTLHTFPETGFAALNLYCCRPRAAWPWESELSMRLGAARVELRTIARGATSTSRA